MKDKLNKAINEAIEKGEHYFMFIVHNLLSKPVGATYSIEVEFRHLTYFENKMLEIKEFEIEDFVYLSSGNKVYSIKKIREI